MSQAVVLFDSSVITHEMLLQYAHVLLLCPTALPPEMSTIWEAYPWRFGGGFCIVKSFISEMTAYASVLTIMAFTIDRYVAICHPLKAQSISSLARAVRIIVIAWMLACGCALPYPVHTRLLYEVQDPCTKKVGTAGSLINSLIDLMNGLVVRLRDWWNLFAGCMHC